MRYRRPFTEDQRHDAISKYRWLRANYRHLRKLYPPASLKERSLLGAYRDCISDFGTELPRPLQQIRPDVLNELEWQATLFVTEFFAERMKHGGFR